jgi:hypothetical protein
MSIPGLSSELTADRSGSLVRRPVERTGLAARLPLGGAALTGECRIRLMSGALDGIRHTLPSRTVRARTPLGIPPLPPGDTGSQGVSSDALRDSAGPQRRSSRSRTAHDPASRAAWCRKVLGSVQGKHAPETYSSANAWCRRRRVAWAPECWIWTRPSPASAEGLPARTERVDHRILRSGPASATCLRGTSFNEALTSFRDWVRSFFASRCSSIGKGLSTTA